MERKVALLADFGSKNILAVSAADTAIVLLRDEDGAVHALEDRCSHEDFPLSAGSYEHGEITCAAHGARFSCTGAPRAMPAFRPVKSYPCRTVGEEIWVDLPED